MEIPQISTMNYNAKKILIHKNIGQKSIKKESLALTSFKGLWREPEVLEHFGDKFYSLIVMYSYYPFKDETPEEIEEVRKKHDYFYESKSKDVSIEDPNYRHDVYEHKVLDMGALPFTREDFIAYISDRLPENKKNLIKKYISKEKLITRL